MAKAIFGWDLSTSNDVTAQRLTVVLDGETVVDQILAPDVNYFEFEGVEQGQAGHVELVALDGHNASKPAVLDFVVPDIFPPAAPTNLSVTFSAD